MTSVEERALVANYLATCARLHLGFVLACDRASHLLPLTPDAADEMPVGDENFILAFLKRYEQFEDALQRTLKTLVQVLKHGQVERLYPVDVSNHAEKLGIVGDAKLWADAVRARNALVHEYPLNPAKRALQINNAWERRETLLATWAGIQRFVHAEGLVP